MEKAPPWRGRERLFQPGSLQQQNGAGAARRAAPCGGTGTAIFHAIPCVPALLTDCGPRGCPRGLSLGCGRSGRHAPLHLRAHDRPLTDNKAGQGCDHRREEDQYLQMRRPRSVAPYIGSIMQNVYAVHHEHPSNGLFRGWEGHELNLIRELQPRPDRLSGGIYDDRIIVTCHNILALILYHIL